MKHAINTRVIAEDRMYKQLTLIASALFVGAFLLLQTFPAHARGVPAEGFADIVEELLPSVVTIHAVQEAPAPEQGQIPDFNLPEGTPYGELFEFFRKRGEQAPEPRRQSAAGSGFVIGSDGIIVTNHHVVKDANEVFVVLEDDRRFEATVIGSDAGADLAVLKIDTKGEKFPAVKFGNSDSARIGDWVIAIGNPWGLGGTVTTGIVSARGRDIDSQSFVDFIQTDAPINQGNSGGPLFNLDGEVIGINTAIYSRSGGSIGLGFAIPSNQAQKIVRQLQEFGTTRRGWLGVSIQSVNEEIAEGLGLDEAKGALISKVHPKSPAAAAGIKDGDVILRFNDNDVPNSSQLRRMVAATDVDVKVPLEVWRNSKLIGLVVVLGEREKIDMASLSGDPVQPEKAKTQAVELLGLELSEITDGSRQQFELKSDVRGVVITGVLPGSDAATKQLAPGMVIVKVNQKEVDSPADVVKLAEAAHDEGRGSILLWVNRGGDFSFVPVKLPKKE